MGELSEHCLHAAGSLSYLQNLKNLLEKHFQDRAGEDARVRVKQVGPPAHHDPSVTSAKCHEQKVTTLPDAAE